MKRVHVRVACLLGTLALLCGSRSLADEKLPAGRRVVRLEAQPPTIVLSNPFAYRQVLVTAHLDNGDQIDATRLAQAELTGAFARVSPTGLVRPSADGKGSLRFTVADLSITVPVAVSGQKARYDVSFVRDVMPTLSKMGCNAGTCHGAQQGKNGFKLSLRGYDPLFDHQSLTDDLEGRRFNRASPENSLMLLKPTGAAPHVGGVLTQPGEPYYELLRAWIAEGVKLDLHSPRVASIDILPKGPVVPLPGMKQQVAVVATYTDGTVRDVSAEAFIESSNNEVATVDKLGLVTAVRRGEATVLARYEGAYTATTLIVMGDRSGYAWKDVPEYNFIDQLVDEKLKAVKILPSDVCSDAEFLRRIYLDLTGLPPQPQDLRAFLADQRLTRVKRDELVDRLVGSNEYVEYWTNKWADLLQVNRKFLGEKGALALRGWIRQAVAGNMPYDQFVYQILTASGSTVENPPAAYYKVLREPGAAMENTTQLFLAVRFNCNKCHDHPFERWTQDQYYQLAAYFAKVARKEDPHYKGQRVGGSAVEGAVPLVEIVYDGAGGDVKHERTGAVTAPRFPYSYPGQPHDEASRREELARWLTARDNPYFAKSYVNRLWSYLLGVGIIEPIDDIRAGNPPTNPKLLERLTREFIDSGFDPQHVVRLICKSRVYQQSITTNRWNQDDDINYSHATARRLPAEALYDAIHRATGSVGRLTGMPAGQRAVQQLDTNVEAPAGFLELFGRPPRESACECERSSGMMLGPVLNLINGPVLADAIRDPGNRIAKLIATEKDDRKIVEELFLSILCRPPTAKELEAGVQALQKDGDEYTRLVAEHDRLATQLAAYEKQIPARQAEWEKQARALTWTTLQPMTVKSAKGATLVPQADGAVLASGKAPPTDVYTVSVKLPVAGVTAVRLEVLADPSLPGKGPGRAPNGNFVLNEFKAALAQPGEAGKPKRLTFARASSDFAQEGFPAANAIDGNDTTGWAVVPQTGRSHVAVFELKEPVAAAGGMVTFTLDQKYQGRDHTIGKFRLAVTTAKPPIPVQGLSDTLNAILALAPEKRTPAQALELRRRFESSDSELARLRKAVADHPRPVDKRLLGAQDLAWPSRSHHVLTNL